MKEQLLKVGTKVFDVQYGWGEIYSVFKNTVYPLRVKFINDNDIVAYTINGKCYESDLVPTLSLTEYTLENGGFTPLSDYNKPKVGDFGFFWDDEDMAIFSKLIKIGLIYKTEDGSLFKYFSKETPDFIKEKLGNNN
jgi:hypothetical protein